MLATVMKPLMTMAGSIVQRAYVPYPAGFGGAVAGSKVPFEASVTQAIARTNSMLKQMANQCPDTDYALTGYSQGAYAASKVAQSIGSGSGPVPADKVIGVSLFGDPTRAKGAALFPGKPGATEPDAAPGTTGANLASIPKVGQSTTPSGGGIGPTNDTSVSYGSLTGRVASHCESGDLACDAPSDAPVVHVVTNIVGQSKLDQDDPVQTLTSLAEALALTSVKTLVPLINEDIQGESLEDLSYTPQQTVSQRLATASDPRTALPSIGDALNAIVKVGTIGLNAVITVAKKVFTPATIASLAATGLANPPAALAMLGMKALEATVELVPPATVNRWAEEAFTAVKQEVTTNSDLLDVSNIVRYWNAAQQHGSYTRSNSTSAGVSAASWTASWFAAVATELAGKPFKPTTKDGVIVADPTLPTSAAVTPTLPDTSAPSPTPTTTTSLPPLVVVPDESTAPTSTKAAS